MQVRVLLYAGSRPRALLRWVQIALKPATKTLGLHGVIIRGKSRKYVMADSAFKRMQVDACACWLDTGKHHRGVALRTSRALNCHEWNDGRQGLRLGHDASLKQAGAQHSLSPEMPGRRSGDCQNIRRQGSQTRVNSRPILLPRPAGPRWRSSLRAKSVDRVGDKNAHAEYHQANNCGLK